MLALMELLDLLSRLKMEILFMSAEGNQLTYLSNSGSVHNLVYQLVNGELLSAVAVDGSGSLLATVFTFSLDQSSFTVHL